MKCYIENDRILNFYPDNYDAGNKEVVIHDIVSFADDIDMDKVSKNQTRENGIFIYYLDNGIVKKRTDDEIKAMPEYVEYQKRQRAEAYKNEADPIFFKYQRGEATQQEWQDKIQAIRDKFPY